MHKASHHFEILKQVRYFTWGEIGPKTSKVLLVLHGYGQHPEYFLRHFQFIASDNVLVVAPEGPHRFYVEGFSGRVGASWMTKEERLLDIEDHINFLNLLLGKLKEQCKNLKELHVLGFSQGVATAVRWLDQGTHRADSLTCWAGSLPPDVEYSKPNGQLSQIPFVAFFGKEDSLVSQLAIEELLQKISLQLPQFSWKSYAGGHKFDKGVLQKHLHKLLQL